MSLHVGQRGLNVQLTMGKTTQQVVANENALLLESTSSEPSATLPDQTLQQPSQTRTPDRQRFVVLLSGALAVLNLSSLYYVWER